MLAIARDWRIRVWQETLGRDLVRLGTACVLVMILAAPSTSAEMLRVRLTYPADSLVLAERDGGLDVRLPDCQLTSRPGAPALPRCAEQIVLPPGMVARGLQVESTASVRVTAGEIRPAQPPAILGPAGVNLAPPAMVPADPAVYEGTALYPAELAILSRSGRLLDVDIASCEVHPVQFDPATRELVLHTEITLTLEVEPHPVTRALTDRTREVTRLAGDMARGVMHGVEHLPPAAVAGEAADVDPDAYQYVIITEEAQRSAFETYAAWKTAKGMPATVLTVEWIDANYPGRDLAEKIRNCVIVAVGQWGTSYVLLGGDHPQVPSRVSWAFDCEAGFYPDENDLYADLYYSDLDGDWDANQNDVFGEVGDQVDLYPDILVGRAPTSDLAQATAVVNKFLMYEQTPAAGRAMEAFFFAEILWQDPYTDSGIGKDMIADAHFGPAYEPIERQYESLGNESPGSVIDYLNYGPHLTNHAGHANWQIMGCGTGYMNRSDASALTNAPHYFVMYSIGCWSAAFDYDCIGERLFLNGGGGAIAFIGNSRYGWGSPGNPGYGYSETFDADFYGAILSDGLVEFGAAVAWPKVLRIPYSQDENVYRWHQYQVNLFGCPEMSCHTAPIVTLDLGAPDQIPTGASQFTAIVEDYQGAVAGARLCLQGPDVYQVGLSDASGRVLFTPDVSTDQILTLTASAPNHPAFEREVIAAGFGPFLAVTETVIEDDAVPPSGGNGDGEIGRGEVIELYITVHNYGQQPCNAVEGSISESNPHVVVLEDDSIFGPIAAGGEATCATPFVFQVAHGCPVGETIHFTLTLSDNPTGTWEAEVVLRVLAPGPRFHHYAAVELAGNGDQIVDPGETVGVTVYVINEGIGDVGPMAATLSTTDSNLLVLQGSAATGGTLEVGEIGALSPEFEVQVQSGCPPITYGELGLDLVHDEGADLDSFLLAIGEAGFADDVESGEGGWTHYGTHNYWHIDDFRQHSGNHSWYCGLPQRVYSNNTDATLESPTFIVPEDAELSFWAYFDVTIYGSDGLFIEVLDDGDWRVVDYLGSGGALGSLLFMCNWAEHTYDVSSLPPGSTSQVRFRLVTDESDYEEGFYLDDVAIGSPEGTTVAVGETPLTLAPAVGVLSPTAPNPVRRVASWQLALPDMGRVTARIYDAQGRLVRQLVDRVLEAGDHRLEWDGVVFGDRRAPAGVYFLRVEAGETQAVRKVVRMRR